jgi:hypothetical protein
MYCSKQRLFNIVVLFSRNLIMKTIRTIEKYMTMLEGIRYENENGGAYAYVQFLAYSRELLVLLRPFKRVERQLEKIEAINWLFNEYLAVKFTPRQRSIFEEKQMELKDVFSYIRFSLREYEKRHSFPPEYHAEAA